MGTQHLVLRVARGSADRRELAPTYPPPPIRIKVKDAEGRTHTLRLCRQGNRIEIAVRGPEGGKTATLYTDDSGALDAIAGFVAVLRGEA